MSWQNRFRELVGLIPVSISTERVKSYIKDDETVSGIAPTDYLLTGSILKHPKTQSISCKCRDSTQGVF